MTGDENEDARLETHHVSRLDEWRLALERSRGRPLLTHLNADTTWLVQIPRPAHAERARGRTHFNVLLDPWLQGPQSDVAGWFSTQWHVVEPGVATLAGLNEMLGQLEPPSTNTHGDGHGHGDDGDDDDEGKQGRNLIDTVVVSHEFTDHCHRATLEELPGSTPVVATDVAAELIRSWGHFDTVVTAPGLHKGAPWTGLRGLCPCLPPWLAVGRVVTPGNSLYYHSAVFVAYSPEEGDDEDEDEDKGDAEGREKGQAIVYSPHGISGDDLASLPASGLETVALLHGLHDVSIWMAKQLNLGALNGIRAVEACGARYWIATHDEVKRGGGLIAPLLRRVRYTAGQAVEHERQRMGGDGLGHVFKELGSGEGITLR